MWVIKLLKRLGLKERFIFNTKRAVGLHFLDWATSLLDEKDDSYPPNKLNFVGSVDFKAVGFEFLRYFIEFGNLKPTDHVLDIGCGIGRMAIPLINYLKHGTYNGIDIVPAGIDWCKKNITPKHPNFSFDIAGIHNKTYNPSGTATASHYTFPYSDGSFDFILLTSVFTHLVPEDAYHYIDEISRLLKPGGRVFSTWFLLNDESLVLIKEKELSITFNHTFNQDPNVLITNPSFPEDAIAYSEHLIMERFSKKQMTVDRKIYGKWCSRTDYVSFQDILIATKT